MLTFHINYKGDILKSEDLASLAHTHLQIQMVLSGKEDHSQMFQRVRSLVEHKLYTKVTWVRSSEPSVFWAPPGGTQKHEAGSSP